MMSAAENSSSPAVNSGSFAFDNLGQRLSALPLPVLTRGVAVLDEHVAGEPLE